MPLLRSSVRGLWALEHHFADLRHEHGHFTPDWVYPGAAKIQRHLAPYAMSRDEEEYRKVERDVALYRLALGQPRQEDMIALVRKQTDAGASPARINLKPEQQPPQPST